MKAYMRTTSTCTLCMMYALLGRPVALFTWSHLYSQGPSFPSPLSSPDDIKSLKYPVDIRSMLGYVMKAITLTRHKLEGRVPLFGFCGAPVSVFVIQ